MKCFVMAVGLLLAVPSMSVTVQESGQYKRMSAKYVSDPKVFFDRKVKVATLLVKCHPSGIGVVTCIGSEGTKQNQPFACSVADGDSEHLFFAYAKKSSRICRELTKYHSDNKPDGEVECYMTVEKLAVDFILLNEKLERVRERIDGCWIKEFMPKDKYESFAGTVKIKGKASAGVEKNELVILPEMSNSVSIAMFKADKTASPVRYLAEAQIDDYYNYDFRDCEKTHWSINLSCKDMNSNEGSFHGYALKKSILGESIKNFLKDGRVHTIEVVLAHPRRAEGSDVCEILAFEEVLPSAKSQAR